MQASTLGTLAIGWGIWTVVGNGLALTSGQPLEVKAGPEFQAAVDSDEFRMSVYEGLVNSPEWQQVPPAMREQMQQEAERAIDGMTSAYARAGQRRIDEVLPMERVLQFVAIGLGLIWVWVGYSLVSATHGALTWIVGAALVTIGWSLVGPFLIQGLVERDITLELATTYESSLLSSDLPATRSITRGLTVGWAIVFLSLKRIAIPCLWSGFVLYVVRRARIQVDRTPTPGEQRS